MSFYWNAVYNLLTDDTTKKVSSGFNNRCMIFPDIIVTIVKSYDLYQPIKKMFCVILFKIHAPMPQRHIHNYSLFIILT